MIPSANGRPRGLRLPRRSWLDRSTLQRRAQWIALAVLASVSVLSRWAPAHEEGVGIAFPLSPQTIGTTADDRFELVWADAGDLPEADTGTVTIDWFYTKERPATFAADQIPPELQGTPIVRGILEAEDTNRHVWNTSTVAPGLYWLYSVLREAHEGTYGEAAIFSRAPLIIAHAGDEHPPAILLAPPFNPYAVADQSFDIDYETYDPDNSATVMLEVMTRRDGADAVVVAADLPPIPEGRYTWDTTEVPEGQYILRATVTDARGQTAVTYGHYFVRVDHTPIRFDAGPADGGEHTNAGEGCTCAGTRR